MTSSDILSVFSVWLRVSSAAFVISSCTFEISIVRSIVWLTLSVIVSIDAYRLLSIVSSSP